MFMDRFGEFIRKCFEELIINLVGTFENFDLVHRLIISFEVIKGSM